MQRDTIRSKLCELQGIITKMPLTVCCSMVLPEFGLRWKEVSRAVRNCRMPMQSSSVARVLCQYLSKSMQQDELDDILAQLRLKLVATQPRTWHVLHLHEPTDDEPVAEVLQTLPWRVLTALQNKNKGAMRPVVHTVMMGDLMYLSVQFASDVKKGSVLYIATPPGQPVAQISSLAGERVLKPIVEGLGYSSYTRADLHGSHIPSLLRVAEGAWGPAAGAAPYAPAPTATQTGVDYTHTAYDLQYVDSVLGPDPPLLTQLSIKTSEMFFHPARFNKIINLTFNLKCDNVIGTLKGWVAKGAISADSDFIKLLQKTKSNKITYNKDGSESE